MKKVLLLGAGLALFGAAAIHADPLDRVDDALSWSTFDGTYRAHMSGILDLEEYAVPHPAPGVIDSEGEFLFNPRLALYLDAQLGTRVYVFAQARVDRGFDPSPDRARARLDEYAVRWTAAPRGRLDLQVGKFATVVGNWTGRHDSWTNAFITAPLPYENLTGIWDSEPPHSARQLLVWSHVIPGLPESLADEEKYLRVPIIWGPSYATGAAAFGEWNKLRYAVEVKNAALSSRPHEWGPDARGWNHATVSARVGIVPKEGWQLGWSASTGSYLRPDADGSIPAPHGRGDYREELLGQDVAYAWHHFQAWAEIYAVRFRIPEVGNPETLAYYLETRYRFAPQFTGAVRWNQQRFGTIDRSGTAVRWGRNVWRIDVAPEYRLTPHVQLKVQYSLGRGDARDNRLTQFAATQLTVRF